jgi:hypothetical protein
MAVYCSKCRDERGMPHANFRTSHLPCQFCQGFDQIQERVHVGRPPNRRIELRAKDLKNFTYPDYLIDGMPGNANSEAEKEYQEG